MNIARVGESDTAQPVYEGARDELIGSLGEFGSLFLVPNSFHGQEYADLFELSLGEANSLRVALVMLNTPKLEIAHRMPLHRVVEISDETCTLINGGEPDIFVSMLVRAVKDERDDRSVRSFGEKVHACVFNLIEIKGIAECIERQREKRRAEIAAEDARVAR